jgi:hypothetical protein
MFKEARINTTVLYQCDQCKRDILYVGGFIEIEDLFDFRRELIQTMNVEGHNINGKWICPDCVVKPCK